MIESIPDPPSTIKRGEVIQDTKGARFVVGRIPWTPENRYEIILVNPSTLQSYRIEFNRVEENLSSGRWKKLEVTETDITKPF